MRRVWGLCMFCVGVGMAVKVLIPTTLVVVMITAALLIVGYNLFCK